MEAHAFLRRRAPILFLPLIVAWPLGALPGQAPPPEPQDAAREEVPAEAIEELVAALEDPERRARLIEQLKVLSRAARAAEEPPPAVVETELVDGLMAFFRRLSDQLRETAIQLVEQLGKLPERARELGARLEDPESRRAFLGGTLSFAGVVAVSVLAAIAAWLLLRRHCAWLAAEGAATRPHPAVRFLRLSGLLILGLGPPLTLAGAALAMLAVLHPPEEAQILALALVWAIAVKHIAVQVLDFLLAARVPALRLLPMGDERARALQASLSRLATLAVYGHFALLAIERLGAESELLVPLKSLYGIILLVPASALVLRERHPARESLLLFTRRLAKEDGEGAASWRSTLASVLNLWWIAAIIYLVGLYMVSISGVEGIFSFVLGATVRTLAIIAAAVFLTALIKKLLLRFQENLLKLSSRFPDLQRHMPQYRAGIAAVLAGAVWVMAVSLCLEAWGISALEALGSRAGQAVFSALFGILIVLLLAAATIDLASVFTQRYLDNRRRTGQVSGKVLTLVPLIAKAVRTAVVVIAAIMILSHLGMNIGPLLAGVGVIGLAIGFGAQTLVKDIITGIFILLEDTISVGDVVSVDGTGGLVEAVNIRTIRLRDLSGNVHTIPFSSVGKVTNMTKDFSQWLIEAKVAYREDVDEVIAVLKELGEEMRADLQYGPAILEPLEIIGLDRFEDSAVVVRARFKTRPLQQWRVGREFNRRMKKEFDRRGIELPFPHRTIYFGEGKAGPAPPGRIRLEEPEGNAK